MNTHAELKPLPLQVNQLEHFIQVCIFLKTHKPALIPLTSHFKQYSSIQVKLLCSRVIAFYIILFKNRVVHRCHDILKAVMLSFMGIMLYIHTGYTRAQNTAVFCSVTKIYCTLDLEVLKYWNQIMIKSAWFLKNQVIICFLGIQTILSTDTGQS